MDGVCEGGGSTGAVRRVDRCEGLVDGGVGEWVRGGWVLWEWVRWVGVMGVGRR